MRQMDRREFLKLAGVGGVVFASTLPGCASMGSGTGGDFYFLQLSDVRWGYDSASVKPDFKGTLPKAIAAVNALDVKPDFVVFTGDLTQTTDDPKLRRARLAEFRDMAAKLNVPEAAR